LFPKEKAAEAAKSPGKRYRNSLSRDNVCIRSMDLDQIGVTNFVMNTTDATEKCNELKNATHTTIKKCVIANPRHKTNQ
jgi:glycyl-tRNA synthetase (class II)